MQYMYYKPQVSTTCTYTSTIHRKGEYAKLLLVAFELHFQFLVLYIDYRTL